MTKATTFVLVLLLALVPGCDKCSDSGSSADSGSVSG